MRRAAFLFAVVAGILGCSSQRADPPRAARAREPRPAPPMETAILDAQMAAERAVARPPRVRKVVLHVGDSMVGYGHGLSRALQRRFEAMGIEYHWDSWTSANIPTVDGAERKRTGDRDRSAQLDRLIATYHPDLILLNLGTNNLAIPRPEAYAAGIRSIAAHLAQGGRDCLWIGPLRPKWKYNPDMFDVLKRNVAPCQYFDSSSVHPTLQSDDIHPTDSGGELWAKAVWSYLGEPPIDG